MLNSISNRIGMNRLISGSSPPTPSNPWEAYGELGEYIENVGTNSYVKLFDVTPENANTIKLEYDFMALASTTAYQVQGIGGSSTRTTMYAGIFSDKEAVVGTFNANTNYSDIPCAENERINVTIDYSQGKVVFKGVEKTFAVTEYGDNCPFILFGYMTNATNRVILSFRNYRFNYEVSGEKGNLVPLHLTKQSITDAAGRVHEIGSWVMYDTITNTVPAHYGTFTGATVAQVLMSQQQALRSLGVEPTYGIDTNQQQLNSLGVKI